MRMLSDEPGGDAKYHRRYDEQKRGNHVTEFIRPTRYAKEKIVRTPDCGVRSARRPCLLSRHRRHRASEAAWQTLCASMEISCQPFRSNLSRGVKRLCPIDVVEAHLRNKSPISASSCRYS